MNIIWLILVVLVLILIGSKTSGNSNVINGGIKRTIKPTTPRPPDPKGQGGSRRE